MSFINEYISEDDNKKYKIEELWRRYHPWSRVAEPRHWAVDKSSNIYLIEVAVGMEEVGNRVTFVLWIDGAEILVDLRLSSENDPEFGKVSVWTLEKIYSQIESKVPDVMIKSALRSALLVYGTRSVYEKNVNPPQVIIKFPTN